ncbi:MAG: hypothetical protein LBL57_08830 [Tannerella sp.]|nr:hypothetical protein [Tannerella sp.]
MKPISKILTTVLLTAVCSSHLFAQSSGATIPRGGYRWPGRNHGSIQRQHDQPACRHVLRQRRCELHVHADARRSLRGRRAATGADEPSDARPSERLRLRITPNADGCYTVVIICIRQDIEINLSVADSKSGPTGNDVPASGAFRWKTVVLQ